MRWAAPVQGPRPLPKATVTGLGTGRHATGTVSGILGRQAVEWERDMGDISFAGGWDDPDNNKNIYPATETRGATRASRREIVVMLGKLPRARLWCHPREAGRIRDFVACVDDPASPLVVDKGIHPDKYERYFGMHMSVAVSWGPFAGDKYHLYGQRMRSGAWEAELITLFDPGIRYYGREMILLQAGAEPPLPIVVVSSGVPQAQHGSPAYWAQRGLDRPPAWAE